MGQQQCFHCHQPVPKGLALNVEVLGASRPMCCYGCQAVASTIVEKGLSHFYKFREVDNNGTLPLVPEELNALDAELQQYDDPDIQREFVHEQDGYQSATLAVEGMTCAACAWLIERQLQQLPGLQKVVVNTTTDRLKVDWSPQQLQLSDILRAIHQVGYKALPFQQADLEESYERKRKGYIRRLGVAGIASMQTMMVAFGLYFDDIDNVHRLYFWWLSLLFTAPVIVYSCQPFFANAWRALRARTLNMDVPVALAMAVAFIASFYATVTDTGQVYYECVTMFAFLLLAGRYLELLARHRAITNAANLIKLIPAVAEKQAPDGRWEQVMVKYLEAGDVIRIRPGATIPADGELLTAAAWADESMLTGESRPVKKVPGDELFAGSLNQDTPVQLRVTRTRQDTMLASIMQLQDGALEQKPRFVQLADRVSRHFVAGTLIIASLTYIGWSFIAPEMAFWVTLAVLVATCPCALALAAPTAMSGAVSRLNRVGILMKQAALVEKLPNLKTLAVDKTGTLTQGRFSIVQDWFLEPQRQVQLEQIAAGLEQYSEHPLAQPFQRLAQPAFVPEAHNEPGSGLSANIDGQEWRIGSLTYIQQWFPDCQPPITGANVFLANADGLQAAWVVDDELRPETATTLDWYRQQGIRIVMLTGDSTERAAALGALLPIDAYYAELKPDDKLHHLNILQQDGPVLMVGDGLNDAPVLAQADGSVSFGSGAALAQSGSDVVILNGHLSALRKLHDTARLTRQVIRQNYAWALAYNGIILPLAITGQVGPLIAMLGMSVSSLIVMTNSLRLMRPVR